MTYSQAALAVLVLFVAISASDSAREFGIDHEKNTFIMDGEPFQYVSGSLHYFRCPAVYWRDRLRKMREAGLNAVSTYVEWSQHEMVQGEYVFSGEQNITEFIQTAAEEGLYVILRPGPYICAERDMGGFPYWLLRDHPDVYLRTSDWRYTQSVERWLQALMPVLEPLLYGNGGPVIMVQVENEYGFYSTCDRGYLTWLRDIYQPYVGDKAVLYTTDGGSGLQCGKIADVYATVDFGPGTNVTEAFAAQRQFEPTGPFVNSEFYPGWLTHWGEAMAHRDTADVVKTLEEILAVGGNANFYMFHGGTNFGFTAGANFAPYTSDITSYDYDAPLTEAGDITPKYTAIQEVLLRHFPERRTTKRTLDVTPKVAYGDVTLTGTANLLSPAMRLRLGKQSTSTYPKSFEVLDQNYGFLLYETAIIQLGNETRASLELSIPDICDVGTVYINGERVGALNRENQTTTIKIDVELNNRLSILVENLGRINFGSGNNDSKGILSNVTLGGILVQNWFITGYEFKTVEPVLSCLDLDPPNDCLGDGFKLYAGKFVISYSTSEPYLPDTFLDVSKLTKGLVFVNDFNLGRYWSTRGPQYSLYVPGSVLKKAPEENVIVVMDEQLDSESIVISFLESRV